MAVIAHVILLCVTRQQYDSVPAKPGWLEQAPDGGIAHLTWWDGAGCHNVDAWDSEAAFTTFGGQRLGPALAAVDVNVQPEATFYPPTRYTCRNEPSSPLPPRHPAASRERHW